MIARYETLATRVAQQILNLSNHRRVFTFPSSETGNDFHCFSSIVLYSLGDSSTSTGSSTPFLHPTRARWTPSRPDDVEVLTEVLFRLD